MLDEDRIECQTEPILAFTYQGKKKPEPDVKPSPAELRDQLLRWLEAAAPDRRRTLDWFSCWVAEGALDDNGAAKPTALHFYAGPQRFLKAAKDLAQYTTDGDLLVALAGPWTVSRQLPSMSWDNAEARDYALRATDPGKKKLSEPGANWLAFRGLQLLPVAASRSKLVTTGYFGGWKSGAWCWALWSSALTADAARTLLTTEHLPDLPTAARQRRGIEAVLSADVHRTDQGGYGSFSPARMR